MSQYRLSVCIATLNRGEFIGATLDSIISQATDDVEVVVVDGASSDNTPEVVRRCQERFSRLRYFRQDRNRGVDQDYALAVDLALGEYCWLFSDDDLMKPGAIGAVRRVLNGAYGLIISNSEVRTSNLAEILQPRRLAVNEDRVYKPADGDRLLADTGAYLTFIGCVIIKKSLWNARNKQNYFGSLFIHVGVIFQSPLPEDALVIAEPLISIRYGNSMWLEKYFEIWMFKWPELVWSFENFTDQSKRAVCVKEPWRRLLVLFQNRARDAYTPRMYRRWLEPRFPSLWSRTMASLIAHLPGTIANALAILYYLVNVWNPCRRVALVEMRNSRFYLGNLGRRARRDCPAHIRVTSSVSTQ
jgi:glycosyltransferase involved in cell wall biosynthesis